MNTSSILVRSKTSLLELNFFYLIRSFIAGVILPLGFAPFHFPGLIILGLSLLYAEIQNQSIKKATLTGFSFGLSFMGFGVSWIYVSIYSYGHLNSILAAITTLVFIAYLAIFIAIVTFIFKIVANRRSKLFNCFIFSAVWCLGEFLRAKCFTGFPWLLVGFGQFDSPLKHLIPIIGVFGVGFITTLSATFLVNALFNQSKHTFYYLIAFVFIILAPLSFKNTNEITLPKYSTKIGIIQPNLSMRDGWNENTFNKLLLTYAKQIKKSVKKAQVIVLPESAIPVPAVYINEYIQNLNALAKKNNATLLIGIPKHAPKNDNSYYNTITAIGKNHGTYLKQHLVPFGEYIPNPFLKLASLLNIPNADMEKGSSYQAPIMINQNPIVSLICYEVAYPELFRKQISKAQWLVNISDDGWFGHSLAIYQQLQMSQVLSLQTDRYQIVANNDGLSSIIDNNGNIIDSLPSFSAANLYGTVFSLKTQTIWVVFGDNPCFYISIILLLIAFFMKRSYP